MNILTSIFPTLNPIIYKLILHFTLNLHILFLHLDISNPRISLSSPNNFHQHNPYFDIGSQDLLAGIMHNATGLNYFSAWNSISYLMIHIFRHSSYNLHITLILHTNPTYLHTSSTIFTYLTLYFDLLIYLA